jgi:uncharacterized membrane protein YphA (DoxX/SURF4 family)
LFASPNAKSRTLGEIGAVLALLAGILIVIGLWTSLAASVAPIAALLCAGLGFADADHFLFAALSVVVALLGPGAVSLDARLFGWREIRFPHAKTEPGSR